MSRWIVLACAGCGMPPTAAHAPVETARVVTPAVTTPGVVAPRVISDGPPRAAIEAPGGGAVEVLAITPDGKVAITCDELGGVRLWPALDGSLEPRVVDLAPPRQLVIGPRADGFTVVALDEVGGLVVANVDTDGRTRSHVTIDGDPAFAGLAMTELGALAWRTDQTIALVGDDGTLKQPLGTEPGQRLLSVAAAGKQAVAVVEILAGDKREVNVRRLVLEPRLAWGKAIDVGKEVGTDVAISATGKRLAMIVRPDSKPISVRAFDLATGKLLVNGSIGDAHDLGFTDDDHLAVAVPSGVSWIDLAADSKPSSGVANTFSQPLPRLAVGGDHVIMPANGELLIATPASTTFLGYDLESPSVVAAAPDGALVVGSGDAFVSLDTTLHATAPIDFGLGSDSNIAELRWLAGDDWLVERSRVSDGVIVLSLTATDGRKSQLVHTGVGAVQLVMYEPATKLVTLSLGNSPEIDRYDPEHRTIAHVAALPKSKGYEQTELVPVSPALAGGIQMVHVAMRDRMTVQWLRDPSAPGVVASTVTIDGSLAGADAAGRVYAWRNSKAGQLELAAYRDGKETGVVPHDGPVALLPDPSATRLFEVGQRAVALYNADASLAWTQAIAGATQAAWLTDGGIAVVTAGGIARLDAATGSIASVRCGWKFGASPRPHPPTPRVEPLCAQLGR